jgi:hypothetical protein
VRAQEVWRKSDLLGRPRTCPPTLSSRHTHTMILVFKLFSISAASGALTCCDPLLFVLSPVTSPLPWHAELSNAIAICVVLSVGPCGSGFLNHFTCLFGQQGGIALASIFDGIALSFHLWRRPGQGLGCISSISLRLLPFYHLPSCWIFRGSLSSLRCLRWSRSPCIAPAFPSWSAASGCTSTPPPVASHSGSSSTF